MNIDIAARLAKRPAPRATAVADRIMRRLKHIPGMMYVSSPATIYRAHKMEIYTLTTRRLIAIYPGGTMEQAVAPISSQYDFTDPQADAPARVRSWTFAMDSAARCRQARNYKAAREHLEAARQLRERA